MNRIKKITRYTLYALLVAFSVGCTTLEKKTETTQKRIILKEAINLSGYMIYIVEVEGKEYLINLEGGIQSLSNCN